MASNPFEVLRLSPSASEREILLRVRRPFPGADQAALQQAAQEVRFSVEKRAGYELETFHLPDYQGELDDETAQQLLAPLEAFVSSGTLKALGAQLLDYLAVHLPEMAEMRMPTDAGGALRLASGLADADAWLLHDLGLLCQRHVEKLREELMIKQLSRREMKSLEDAARLYLACQMALAGTSGFAAQLEAAQGGEAAQCEAALSAYLDGQLTGSEQMLAFAVNNDNPQVLETLAAAWFDLLSAWGGGESRWNRRLEEILNSELNRYREKVKTSGVEREGVSGKHQDSLELMRRLLVDRGVRSQRLIEIYLDACMSWMNEYINAKRTEYADTAVEWTAAVCQVVLREGVSAKLQSDAESAQTRCMYIADDFEDLGIAAIREGKLDDARLYLTRSIELTKCLTDTATLTLVSSDDSRSKVTAAELRQRVENTLSMIDSAGGVAAGIIGSGGGGGPALAPEMEAVHQEYRKAFDLYKDDKYDQCIPMLERIAGKLRGNAKLQRLDRPMPAYSGRTLLQEVEDTLNYALMYSALEKTTACIDLKQQPGNHDREIMNLATSALALVEKVSAGFAIGTDQKIARLDLLENLETILDSSETSILNMVCNSFMTSIRTLMEGGDISMECASALKLLEGMRDEAYIIVSEDGSDYHTTCVQLRVRLNALSNLTDARSDPIALMTLATFSSCPKQSEWQKQRDKFLQQRKKDEARGVKAGESSGDSIRGDRVVNTGSGPNDRKKSNGSNRNDRKKNNRTRKPKKQRHIGSAMVVLVEWIGLLTGLYFLGHVWISNRPTYNAESELMQWIQLGLLALMGIGQLILLILLRGGAIRQEKKDMVIPRVIGDFIGICFVDVIAIMVSLLVNFIGYNVMKQPVTLPFLITFGIFTISYTLGYGVHFKRVGRF